MTNKTYLIKYIRIADLLSIKNKAKATNASFSDKIREF